MTKKEEFLNYVLENQQTDNVILVERILESPEESMLQANQVNFLSLGFGYDGISSYLDKFYSDDLKYTDTKGLVKQVLFWYCD